MKKYTLLTKHIPTLSCISGADFANRSYPREVLNFIEDQGLFLRQGKYYYLKNYGNILENNSITRSTECVTALDVNKLDADCVISLIVSILQNERFNEGLLASFFDNGCMLKWLKRLRSIDNGLCLYFKNADALTDGIELVAADLDFEITSEMDACVTVTVNETDTAGFTLTLDGKNAIVSYGGGKVRFFRALALLVRWLNVGITEKTLSETPLFKTNGAMLDVSRNAVMKPEYIKFYLRKMALMGLSQRGIARIFQPYFFLRYKTFYFLSSQVSSR